MTSELRWTCAIAIALLFGACGVNDRKVEVNHSPVTREGSGGANAPSNSGSGGQHAAPSRPGTGEIGGPCESDADCAEGICFGSPLDDEKYCAPSCNSNADCAVLQETSYVLNVPETVTPQGGDPTPNQWGTTVLARGVACAQIPETEGGHCIFGCGPFMAMTADQKCYCLPGYKLDDSKTHCEFAPDDIQCTIFSFQTDEIKQGLAEKGIQISSPTCDACNSNMDFTNALGCHTSIFGCEINNTGFKGRCAEFISVDQLNACFNEKTNFDCKCQDGCVDTCSGEGCVDIVDTCCDCTGGGTAPAAKCETKPGGSGSGGSTANDGGTAGTGGGTAGTGGGTAGTGGGAGGMGAAGSTSSSGSGGMIGGSAGTSGGSGGATSVDAGAGGASGGSAGQGGAPAADAGA